MKIRLITLLFAVVFSASAAERILADQGKAFYSIVVQKNATEIDKFAARELQFFLKQITGADFQIKEEATGPALRIGVPAKKELNADTNIVETSGKDILLYGGGMHGNLYAAYELIENIFGCMFLNAYGDLHIPKQNRLVLQDTYRKTTYAFPVRVLMNWWFKDKAQYSLAFYRNRQNALLHSFQHPRYPGKERGIVCVEEVFLNAHSLSRLIPPGVKELKLGYNQGFLSPLKELENKQYFLTNPEFFSMDEKGKRVPNRQLCFSNPELRAELEKNAVQFYKQEYKRTGVKGSIQISCNDIAHRLCWCPNCIALEKEYGLGAPLFLCLIDMAKKHPEIPFRTLAYQRGQTQAPPIKPIEWPKNLDLLFAPINGDYANPWNKGKNNAIDYRDLQNWTKLTRNILVWYYPHPYNRSKETFFIEPPTANLERTVTDVRIMRDLHLKGPYMEFDAGGVQLATNFTEMETWVLFKLFQNPDQDYQKLVDRFLTVYYNNSPEVKQYYRELSEAMRRFTAAGGTWNYKTMDTPYLTAKNLLHWETLLNTAEQNLKGEYAFRVRLLRLGLESTIISKVGKDLPKRLSHLQQGLAELEKKRAVVIPWKQFEAWKKEILDRGVELPLPVGFTKIQDMQAFAVPLKGKNIITHPEANRKHAFAENLNKDKKFKIQLYDKQKKLSTFSRIFEAADFDAKAFSWIQITTRPVTFTPSTALVAGSWWMSFPLGARVTTNDDAASMRRQWHIWLSIKFENGKVLCDRAVLIPAKDNDTLSLIEELPLPEDFAKVKDVQSFAVPAKGKTVIKHTEANLKRAFSENLNKDKKFKINLYDKQKKRAIYSRVFSPAEFNENSFSWIKATTRPVTLTPSTTLFGGSWLMSFPLGARVTTNDDAVSLKRQWHIWLSVKFENGKVLCDRAVLIPVTDKDAK